ncbi:50S ribosomal protein L25 [Candidatus Roizmanbacteria bacterium CG11_big_fil_rev_8_21_14_0_20_36_8]|uniref:Large ribosomal subunit protein bL25 n=2 Tax=Candidatus Roizmaniibacteriota TaxID=1752723 RepID=A0A2M6IU45_9BACT|nr:MAG: 50S ribosomal protein L25 [Candidatus Roizmanbacteria bacterium CG11_big_fil_rev_8_21_14_0_20_36_8]PIZ66237.1 MAG: 50S ribosomal protein L25 [Candidatus Roizmanbacteria bacterium CG_4_10_14_0_2_um_filter_36_9]
MEKTQKKDRIILNASLRKIFGKQTRSMRKNGLIPANIFGEKMEPLAISFDQKAFNETFKIAGETNVVYIAVDSKKIPTLISEIQIHPVTQSILHIDLRKIDLTHKIEAHVPILLVGESEAVESKNGVVISQMDEVKIESLPEDIPNQIEIDISKLSEIGDIFRVSDLVVEGSFVILDEPERAIVSIIEHKEEEIEPETVSEDPEIIGKEAEEEGAETTGDNNQEQKKE